MHPTCNIIQLSCNKLREIKLKEIHSNRFLRKAIYNMATLQDTPGINVSQSCFSLSFVCIHTLYG